MHLYIRFGFDIGIRFEIRPSLDDDDDDDVLALISVRGC